VLNPDGSPDARQFLLPKDQACLLDVWDVGGMRGTGSTDYACDGVFAPDEMWVRAFNGQSNHPTPSSACPSPSLAWDCAPSRSALRARLWTD